MNDRPTAKFVGITYAGWSTRYQNLERHVVEDGRLDATFHRVSGWTDGGLIERLPLPSGVRGRCRSTLEARALAAIPRPNVIWTSASSLMLPYLPLFKRPFRRPLVVEMDWTVGQQETMSSWYYGRPSRSGRSLDWALARERQVFSHVSLFTPMSHWAADGLRGVGVDDDRIVVLNPGLDLDVWTFTPRMVRDSDPLRVLFVGGDFVRKGGDLLLDMLSGAFASRLVVDVVTRDHIDSRPSLTVHRCEANSPELRALYAACDLFVLPTRADCFGHAVAEALASGAPVIVGDVGGVADMVQEGTNGWRIEPTAAALEAALREATEYRARLPAMGAAGRRIAEERLDGRANDRRLVDLMLELVDRDRRRRDRAQS